MLVESVLIGAGVLTGLLQVFNETWEDVSREKNRRQILIDDGSQAQTVEYYQTGLLMTDEEIFVVNNPHASREERGAALGRAQERTENNPAAVALATEEEGEEG